MTGIADVFKHRQQAARLRLAHARELLLQALPPRLALWLRPHLGALSTRHLLCPQPLLPDPRPTLEYNAGVGVAQSQDAAAAQSSHNSSVSPTATPDPGTPPPSDAGPPAGNPAVPREPPSGPLRWALLLPITSRGVTSPEAFWDALAETSRLLLSSISPSHAPYTTIYAAIDMKDPLLDTDDGHARLAALLSPPAGGVRMQLQRLPPAYAGNICWIWAKLAQDGVNFAAVDLFLLIGDDVHFDAPGWQAAVEGEFAAIAADTGLPFGCACVAVRDHSFAAFPTFPVLHRLHLDVFGEVFPRQFKNQHGDPFLWEVYRRWGASRFAPLPAALHNRVGGAAAARYAKAGEFVWRDEILTDAIATLERFLTADARCGGAHAARAARVPCLDIVVPTYRCDAAMLRAFADLGAKAGADVSLQTLIVVDRPDAAELPEIEALASYDANRVVRVHVMRENLGASMARNTGLAQSFGDHAVLLDDDVVPDVALVRAYVGAIARNPDAAGFVGVTRLPPPATLMQAALVACNICFFYGVAARMAAPPWGVTANLCVRARSNNRVWFDTQFPRSGGGEDVDFCLRLAHDVGHGFVAVPGAVVEHPFWRRPLRQVAGWARGDVLCLDTNPSMMFWAPPNWPVLALASLLLLQRPLWAAIAVCLEVVMSVATYAPRVPRELPAHRTAVVALLAAVPPLLQDTVRVVSKILRGRWTQLLQHFDWMAGREDHSAATQVTLLLKLLLWFCAVAAAELPRARGVLVAVLCCALGAWVRWQGRVMPAQVAYADRALPLDPDANGTPFVVLATQRTGSNMLCGLLHGVRNIAMHNELFNEKGVFSHCGVDADMCSVYARDAAPRRFLLRALAARPPRAATGPGSRRAVGFKLFPEHIRRSTASHELFGQVLADPAVKKVVLVRENRLAVCASRLRAAVTGAFTHKTLDDVKVVIDPAGLQRSIDTYDEYYAYLRKVTAGQGVLWLTYEGMCSDPLAAVQEVCRHVGVAAPSELPRNVFQPQSGAQLRDAVVGWERLRAAFEGDPRLADFQEDRGG